jgi:putative addiction module killer protein
MVVVDTTSVFDKWLRKLKNYQAKSIISNHIDRMEEDNFGDAKSVGDGIYEKRINYGPGYRLYYCQMGKAWVMLLCGGDKSTQRADINRAKEIKKGLQ